MRLPRPLALLPLLALTASLALADPAAAFSPGARSLGDPLLPQIGNGGYNARHYDIRLDYAPGPNKLRAGTTTTMRARAKQSLSRFSLDFQRLRVTSVKVNGSPAGFVQRNARPRLSPSAEVTQPAKLIVTPAAGIPAGTVFNVEVAYRGRPEAIVDADGSSEGWMRACRPGGGCDGAITMNEPIGAQSWFPSNNHPSDKATVDTSVTVPAGFTAIGAGELEAETVTGGRTTWSWTEPDPAATYLLSATVGSFDVHDARTMVDQASGRILPIFTAIDSAGPPGRKAAVRAEARRIPGMVNFLSSRVGRYPFGSVGLVADWVPSVGYALENQTKPHFPGNTEGPVVGTETLAHELAHQWMGNSVSPRDWSDIWFNEGWATFLALLWDAKHRGGQTPHAFLRSVLDAEPRSWRLAPAVLDHDPANLFSGFAVYSRPAAMLQGYREIVGSKRFFRLAARIAREHRHATISGGGFVRKAKAASGMDGRRLRKLGRYFRQWLHGERRPKLTPADFRRPRRG